MLLLNLGCGAERPLTEPWKNIDDLFAIFPDPKVPERVNLSKEPNYVNHDLSKPPMPIDDNSVDGIIASHFFEHLDLQQSILTLKDCWRVLKVGGVIRASTPDPEMFYKKTIAGDDNWGEPNNWGVGNFMKEALCYHEHRQLLTAYSLLSLLYVGGFTNVQVVKYRESGLSLLTRMDNRPEFSVFVEATKT